MLLPKQLLFSVAGVGRRIEARCLLPNRTAGNAVLVAERGQLLLAVFCQRVFADTLRLKEVQALLIDNAGFNAARGKPGNTHIQIFFFDISGNLGQGCTQLPGLDRAIAYLSSKQLEDAQSRKSRSNQSQNNRNQLSA